MTPMDLFSLNLTNLDALTENYDLHFYLNYLMKWPSLFTVVEDREGQIIGYSTAAHLLLFGTLSR
jgi:N-terminal acetyltransferase B complex catalytic subunit